MNDFAEQTKIAQVWPLVEHIRTRYALEPITEITRLAGGEWKTLWRLTGARHAYVVSISHPTTDLKSIAYEHRLLRYLHAALPQIPAPLLATDGSSYFLAAGRIVSLYPFLPGEMADSNTVRLSAARLLAAFHGVGQRYPDQSPRPDVRPWHTWDWCAAEWPLIEEALASPLATTNGVGQRFWQAAGKWAPQICERGEQIKTERTYFQQWLTERARTIPPLTSGLVHDDYHDNNLLAEGTQITALLDWDDCHPDWLVLDLSNGMWEFCHVGESLDITAARAFLQAYTEAGGPVKPAEFALLIPLIRCRRMREVMVSLRGMATGSAWDESPDYLVHNLIALENLRGLQL